MQLVYKLIGSLMKAMVQYYTCHCNDYLIYTVTHNNILYTGMMYHEKKEVCHWKTMYTVVRDLDVLIEV